MPWEEWEVKLGHKEGTNLVDLDIYIYIEYFI
jgi:hypothetical protein